MLFSIELSPGEVVGDEFVVEGPIGQGGYAIVYAGYRLSDNLPVVIKTPREGTRDDDVALKRFEREAQVVKGFDHPHVVRMLGYGHHPNGVPYIVMERLQGCPLSQLIAKGPLQAAEVLHILRQLLNALAAAHRQGLVHRDMKPTNVFVLAYGDQSRPKAPYYVKVLDFGLVMPLPENQHGMTRITQQGRLVGTPGYMAPEMILLEPVTPAADIYGVGVIAFEALTGQRAFPGGEMDAMVLQQRNQTTVPPPAVASMPMFGVVQQMMAPDLKARFVSCAAALKALEAAAAKM